MTRSDSCGFGPVWDRLWGESGLNEDPGHEAERACGARLLGFNGEGLLGELLGLDTAFMGGGRPRPYDERLFVSCASLTLSVNR